MEGIYKKIEVINNSEYSTTVRALNVKTNKKVIIKRPYHYALICEIAESERQISYSKESDKIKIEFFSNISHELRTPINVIFSALQVQELKKKGCQCKNRNIDCYKYGNILI